MLRHRPETHGFVPIARQAGPRATAMSAMSSRARTQRRRRDIFVGMLAAMVTSLVLGFVPSLRILWVVHLLVDAMFVTYVALLVHMRNQAAEKEMKVRFLPQHLGTRTPEPALLLRRSAH
jgi:predicted tellurium resistance membrane protein TerC